MYAKLEYSILVGYKKTNTSKEIWTRQKCYGLKNFEDVSK